METTYLQPFFVAWNSQLNEKNHRKNHCRKMPFRLLKVGLLCTDPESLDRNIEQQNTGTAFQLCRSMSSPPIFRPVRELQLSPAIIFGKKKKNMQKDLKYIYIYIYLIYTSHFRNFRRKPGSHRCKTIPPVFIKLSGWWTKGSEPLTIWKYS